MSLIKIDTDLIHRSKKEYKNKGFEFVIREALTNAIHACIMSKKDMQEIVININTNNNNYNILIKDNGIGFDDHEYHCITKLDLENDNKISNNLPSLGQGRLSFIYFCSNIKYVSIYKKDNQFYKREFTYPNKDELFQCDSNDVSTENETYTKLELETSSKSAKTFFEKYKTVEEFKDFILLNFFPLLNRNKNLSIKIKYLLDKEIEIKLDCIKGIDFDIEFDNKKYTFCLYKIPNIKENHKIDCFAKGLLCKMDGSYQLKYDINDNSKLYLESDLFDENVDGIGDKIQIENNDIKTIQEKINLVMDKEYKDKIEGNKIETTKELNKLNRYPTFRGFVDKKSLLEDTRKPRTFDEIKQIACSTKARAEIDYWDGKETIYKDELIKSSLFDYFKYREEILQSFQKDFLQHFNEKGDSKKQNEIKVHDIFFKRRKEIYQEDEIDVYFNHNLWLIDDKFSLFKNVKSAVNGEELPDIMCSPNDSNEINIIELKSTHKAWNEGDMIDKIKDYAKKIYKRDNKIINGAISNTKNARYNAYLIASKSSIDAERNKLTVEKHWEESKIPQIPFLENSYFHDGVFSVDDGQQIPIRIELITYEDLFTLANKRNKPIIDLMYKYKNNE